MFGGARLPHVVIVILGKPDNDEFTTVKNYEQKNSASRKARVRRITFYNLSDEMNVFFTQQIDGTICPSFLPKPKNTAG